MKILSSYGIYRDDFGVSWLQQAKGENAVGLKGDSPFKVDRRKCNHQIDLTKSPSPDDWKYFTDRLSHPLVQAMLPVPRIASGIIYIDGDALEQVKQLARMSSPIRSTVVPIWMLNRKELYDELQESNIQPLVAYGVTGSDTTFIQEVGQYGGDMPRTFLYMANPDFVKTWNSTLLPWSKIPIDVREDVDWEAVGAKVVRDYMRGTSYATV